MLLKRTFTLKNKVDLKSKEKLVSKTTKKENKENEKFNHPKKLSNFINTDKKMKYILKNKSALKEYEIFLNRFKKKKKQITFGSINKNYQYQNKMSIFKDNPRLIISSYKANFLEDSNKKKRYQNNILGVDEGLITLPKINLEEDQNYLIESEKIFKMEENTKKTNNKEDKDILSNIYSNTEIKIEDKNNIINNNESNKYNNTEKNNNYEKRMKSSDFYWNKNRNIKESHLDRGEEVISKFYTNRNKKKEIESYNSKANKTLNNFHSYKYEIRRLNKWDFNNLSKDKNLNTNKNSNKTIKNILSEIRQTQQLNLLTEIKNNKEQFKIVCRNKHLKDFINKINDDQNAIYMQNVKILKKDFNFKVFDEKGNSYNKDIDNNNNQLKSDTYNEIMRKKLKLEENLSYEVGLCAEQVYKYKNKIENEMKKKFNLNNDLMSLKKKEDKINEEYNENIKRLDLLLQQLDNTLNQKNSEKSNKNGSESKNNNIKYNETLNKLSKSTPFKHRNSNVNMGNLNSKRLSIINSIELAQIRTLTINKKDKNNIYDTIIKSKPSTKKIVYNNDKNKNNSSNELLETKDEILIIKNNLLAEKNSLDKKHKKEILTINEKKNEIKNEMNKRDDKIKKISKELSKAKNYLNEHIQSLSDYYYQILKKGIDVRRNGLSWVVIKLMELNAFIDYQHFPNFLDMHQIEYLMKIGAKIYEVKELIKLFQLLKQKEKIIKEKHYNEDRNKEIQEKKAKLNQIKKENNNKIGNNYVEYMEEIQHKYDQELNFNIDEELENIRINKTSKYLREIIMHDWEKNMESYYIPGSLAEYFSKDKKFRQYFDDAYYLKEEINKRQNDINKEKEKELKYYKNKFKIQNFEEQKEEIKNNYLQKDYLFEEKNEDLSQNIRQIVFAALFGNNTRM